MENNENMQPATEVTLALSQEDIQRKIYTVRGLQVILDRDLAFFYGVETKYINRAVKRNPNRFPDDFVFQLTHEEYEFVFFPGYDVFWFKVPFWHLEK